MQTLADEPGSSPTSGPWSTALPDLAAPGEEARREAAQRGVRTFDDDGVPVGHVLSRLR